ncbi:MAG: energy-dependent translational throttle protein EttA [Fibrobacterota bacterium]
MAAEQEKIIYSMNGVNRSFGQKKVLKDISLSYFYGAKIGVVGLNGSGKSTLLRILAGRDDKFTGDTKVTPGYTIGYLEQEPLVNEDKTVIEVVEEGAGETAALLKEFEQINMKFAEPMSDDEMNDLINRQGEVQEELDKRNAWDLESRLDMAMDALRCPPRDAEVARLSGGERRRVALCRLLLQEPDILLLDEPTNHLDAESVAWLEQHLKRYAGTVIAVTHDRFFLDNVAGWILELDNGEGIPWKGNYSSWLEQKRQQLHSKGETESRQAKVLAHELEWLNMTPKDQHEKAKQRIASYSELLTQGDNNAKDLEIYIPPGPRLGDVVIEAKNVKKAFGDRLLYENMNFSLPAGGIVGVIGPNGAGKTTLFKMITGEESPDEGTFKIGDTVKLAYVDQKRDNLDPEKTVWEMISGGRDMINMGGKEINSRAYVSKFNFNGGDQQKKIKEASGGMKNRVNLALLLQEGANVILLDEPTNDLDITTLRSLEEALQNFAGCAVVISHDRWFLDRVATHILSFEGDSQVKFFDGNYSEYEEDKKQRLGKDAAQPHRIKYRHLTRD